MSAAIATLDLGLGFEAGLSVVILAIYLDRVTASLGQGKRPGLALWPKRRETASNEDDADAVEDESPQDAALRTTKVGGKRPR